ncbi:MAG: UDP-glucose/GDP-mannose dehydrogenase family protein, partial [Candidatus Diapherotrites archaeon]|nr:UDP-glucose/GDP-mannose dehydrogenase family protein [Candidatus Diapherotrites archaeon]
MDICIIGTGYVGLVTGTCFAKLGHSVRCVDIDEEKVRRINAGDPPIFEKGLKPLLEEVLASGRFRATLDLKDAVNRTDMAFISVPTPSREDGSIDLRFVRAVGGQLGDVLRNDAKDYCVIMKSTVVPGTTGELARILEEHAGRRIPVGMNPEFLKEGVAIEDFLHPDRIVLGADDPQVMEKLRGVYSSLNAPKLETTTCTAEMIKYASNAFLATKISFINEVGNACKELGIDSYVVAEGMGLDSRISPRFLASGMGFGGSCFPKDVAALRAKVRELGLASHVLDAVLRVN